MGQSKPLLLPWIALLTPYENTLFQGSFTESFEGRRKRRS